MTTEIRINLDMAIFMEAAWLDIDSTRRTFLALLPDEVEALWRLDAPGKLQLRHNTDNKSS